MHRPVYLIIVFLTGILFFTHCQDRSSYEYQPPAPYPGLETGSLSDVGMKIEPVSRAISRLKNGRYKEIHSFLIYKDGLLVLEEYFPGHDYQWAENDHHGELKNWTRDDLHYAHSVSKSVTSILMGVAVKEGFISDLDQSIFKYLPEYAYLNTGDKKYINIEHLLTCTSGLFWEEWNAPLSSRANNQIDVWFHEKGPVDYVLKRHFIAVPGTHFNYSGGAIDILGEILKNASGMNVDEFSRKYLFDPIGIDTIDWSLIHPSGVYHVAGGLRMKPIDMVKLGILMLNQGKWNDQEILSEDWVKKSMYPYQNNINIKLPNEDIRKVGYSYTWWTKSLEIKGEEVNIYFGNGWGGQKIIVIPDLGMVVVFTGANYLSKIKQFSILEKYVFPAITN